MDGDCWLRNSSLPQWAFRFTECRWDLSHCWLLKCKASISDFVIYRCLGELHNVEQSKCFHSVQLARLTEAYPFPFPPKVNTTGSCCIIFFFLLLLAFYLNVCVHILRWYFLSLSLCFRITFETNKMIEFFKDGASNSECCLTGIQQPTQGGQWHVWETKTSTTVSHLIGDSCYSTKCCFSYCQFEVLSWY